MASAQGNDSGESTSKAKAASSPATTKPSLSKEEIELDKLLNREATALNRELEVERILKAFKLKYVHSN